MKKIGKYYNNTEAEKPRNNVRYFIGKRNAIRVRQLS